MTTTRFAPSPTGYIHVGNLRTALFNYLIARKSGGSFILRIDDTDPERSKESYVEAIKEDLAWLGLHWDRVERQSERLGRYEDAAARLREAGRLYEAFETPEELDLKRKKQMNMGRPPVYDRTALSLSEDERATLRRERGAGAWRFLLDQTRIQWEDGIQGAQNIDAASLSDPVLIRGDGQFLYTLASVVDDIEMGVTDVVRGGDHITNTATQIQIMAALGAGHPRFAHHSLLTGAGGEALSKRLGTLALRDLRAAGIEPMALVNLMARLGSGLPVELHGGLAAVAEGFDLSAFGAAPTKFDAEDLRPLTHKLLAMTSYEAAREDVLAAGVPEPLAPAFWEAVRDNLDTRADLALWWQIAKGEIDDAVAHEDKAFVSEAMAMLPQGPLDQGSYKAWTDAVKAATGRKGAALFRPLRLALTGRAAGPDMGRFLPILQQARGGHLG